MTSLLIDRIFESASHVRCECRDRHLLMLRVFHSAALDKILNRLTFASLYELSCQQSKFLSRLSISNQFARTAFSPPVETEKEAENLQQTCMCMDMVKAATTFVYN